LEELADELPDDLSGTIGVTAGASAPEDLVQAVVERMAPRDGVELVTVTEEEEYFPPPRELRDLQRALGVALAVSLGAPLPPADGEGDRAVAASDALDALAS
jgi:4-hydroxy-3-methylbut-2-enyl diphosphate reductase